MKRKVKRIKRVPRETEPLPNISTGGIGNSLKCFYKFIELKIAEFTLVGKGLLAFIAAFLVMLIYGSPAYLIVRFTSWWTVLGVAIIGIILANVIAAIYSVKNKTSTKDGIRFTGLALAVLTFVNMIIASTMISALDFIAVDGTPAPVSPIRVLVVWGIIGGCIGAFVAVLHLWSEMDE